jgi:hypothetical protein
MDMMPDTEAFSLILNVMISTMGIKRDGLDD